MNSITATDNCACRSRPLPSPLPKNRPPIPNRFKSPRGFATSGIRPTRAGRKAPAIDSPGNIRWASGRWGRTPNSAGFCKQNCKHLRKIAVAAFPLESLGD